MYDAVRGVVVGGGDLGAVDEDAAARDPHRQALAFNGRDHLAVREVLGVQGARDHVVGEDVDELRLVLGLEQVGDHPGRERGKGLVGRGEDGERAGAVERVDQVAGLERGNQRGEVRGGGGKLRDGLSIAALGMDAGGACGPKRRRREDGVREHAADRTRRHARIQKLGGAPSCAPNPAAARRGAAGGVRAALDVWRGVPCGTGEVSGQ